MKTYAYYGAGSHAQDSLQALREQVAASGEKAAIVLIDDDPEMVGTLVHGEVQVLSWAEARIIPGLAVCVAIADSGIRRQKVAMIEADGVPTFSVFAQTAIIGPNVRIGEGAIFSHNTLVSSNSTVGRAFHCNAYSYVAHHCEVGDFVTLGGRVSIHGRIRVEDDVYIGSGANFLHGKPGKYLTVGKGSIIGAGTLVTADVEPYTIVVSDRRNRVVRRPRYLRVV